MTTREIIESIKRHPEEWYAFDRVWHEHGHSHGNFKDYCIHHKDGTEVWIANGPWFCGQYDGHTLQISILDKIRLFFWYSLRKKKMITIEQHEEILKVEALENRTKNVSANVSRIRYGR